MLFSQSLDWSKKGNGLVAMSELVYQIDTIEVDDSYLQLGWSSRERKFMNLKSHKYYEVSDWGVTDPKL